MPSHRPESVGKNIQVELSDILRTETKDPRLGFVTITGVSMTRDLRTAKVYLSVLGDETERQLTLEGLSRAAPFLRRTLAQRLRLRHAPELFFAYDDTLERGAHIDRLLDELKP